MTTDVRTLEAASTMIGTVDRAIDALTETRRRTVDYVDRIRADSYPGWSAALAVDLAGRLADARAWFLAEWEWNRYSHHGSSVPVGPAWTDPIEPRYGDRTRRVWRFSISDYRYAWIRLERHPMPSIGSGYAESKLAERWENGWTDSLFRLVAGVFGTDPDPEIVEINGASKRPSRWLGDGLEAWFAGPDPGISIRLTGFPTVEARGFRGRSPALPEAWTAEKRSSRLDETEIVSE